MMSGMNKYQAYKNTNHKSKNEYSIRKCCYQISDNIRVREFLEKVDSLPKISKTIMDREEGLETLSRLARGKITDLMEAVEVSLGKDDSGNPIKKTILFFKENLLNDPERSDIVQEYSINDTSIKVKTYSKISAISEISAICNWSKQEEETPDDVPTFSDLLKQMRNNA